MSLFLVIIKKVVWYEVKTKTNIRAVRNIVSPAAHNQKENDTLKSIHNPAMIIHFNIGV